jgi:hypothetical protein
MDTTISWMIGNRPESDPIAERRYAHIRALRDARPAGPGFTTRLAAAITRVRTGSAPVATSAGPNLAAFDTVCCTA